MLDSEMIAWFAGVYEGEGCCALSGKSTFVIHIAQRDRWLCDQLKERFGGSVNGPYDRKGFKGSKPHFVWNISGKKAEELIKKARPLLSPRRNEQIQAKFDKAALKIPYKLPPLRT